MVVLNDSALHHEADQGMVKPYNPLHVSPCSIDLTLGDKILIESLDQNGNGWVEIDITNPYQLKPKQFILATTAETVRIPDDLSGQIILRSSAARAGWNHALAGWIDPGFNGQITLELTNQKQLNFLDPGRHAPCPTRLLPSQLPRFHPLLQSRQLLRSGGRHSLEQQPSAHHMKCPDCGSKTHILESRQRKRIRTLDRVCCCWFNRLSSPRMP